MQEPSTRRSPSTRELSLASCSLSFSTKKKRKRKDEERRLRSTSPRTYKRHALPTWSKLGSGESDEFATFAQGRSAWEDSAEVRGALFLPKAPPAFCELADAEPCA